MRAPKSVSRRPKKRGRSRSHQVPLGAVQELVSVNRTAPRDALLKNLGFGNSPRVELLKTVYALSSTTFQPGVAPSADAMMFTILNLNSVNIPIAGQPATQPYAWNTFKTAYAQSTVLNAKVKFCLQHYGSPDTANFNPPIIMGISIRDDNTTAPSNYPGYMQPPKCTWDVVSYADGTVVRNSVNMARHFQVPTVKGIDKYSCANAASTTPSQQVFAYCWASRLSRTNTDNFALAGYIVVEQEVYFYEPNRNL